MHYTKIALLLATTSILWACEVGELNLRTPDGENSPSWPNDPNDPNNPNNSTEILEEIDPGRVTIRRLNRVEYNNTIRDLFGDTSQPASAFPEDDYGYGFNNNSDVLSLSLLHLESYFEASAAIIDRALDSGAPASTVQRVEAEDATGTAGSANGDFWTLSSNGTVSQVITFPTTGTYTIRARAHQSQAGPDDANMVVAVGSQTQSFTVTNVASNPGVFEFSAQVTAGGHIVSVEFTNDFYNPDLGEDRNLYVDWFEAEGPTDVNEQVDTSSVRGEIITCTPGDNPQACASEIISQFGMKAWRRPLETTEVDRLVQFLDVATNEGDGFETGIRLALQAILMSPNFLFRPEIDLDHDDTNPRSLTGYEMASRLSYFLWSSMPDAELFELAEQGQLQDEEVLRAQVLRMLDHPKAEALIDTFATQWLYIDAVLAAAPNFETFPDFDEELQQSMREETRLFVKELIDTNAPLKTLITANFTYVNSRLAEHYGMDTAGFSAESGFARREYPDESRRGIISHAGLLTARSHPTMSSPVRRGEWIMANLWCDKPLPPPPNVENIAQSEEEREGKTIRELFEMHSEDPVCASCHKVMDPIGFGLEHYDGIGAWRDTEQGKDIDASGVLPPDIAFNGPFELAGILASSPKLAECAAEKTLTFALGRGMKRSDQPQIKAIAESGDIGFRDLITEVVLSEAFRTRRGGEF